MGITINMPPISPEEASIEHSFERFYRRQLGPSVRRIALILGSGPAAEDLVHDVMAEVYARWNRIENPHAYLRQATLNRAYSWLKQAEREIPSKSVEMEAREVWIPGDLCDLLAPLSPRQRIAVVLKYYEGLPEREIAVAMECQPGSVGPLLARARALLRIELANES